MSRQNIFDRDRRLIGWFNPEKAEVFEEDVEWDGSNRISVNTGTQWDHETLYRTATGRWILCHWSQWQGSRDWWEYLDEEAARLWLLKNKYDEEAKRYFGEIEEERGPGRPEIGPTVQIRLPEEMLARLDAEAQRTGEKRAEIIRRFVADGLARPQKIRIRGANDTIRAYDPAEIREWEDGRWGVWAEPVEGIAGGVHITANSREQLLEKLRLAEVDEPGA